MYNMRKNRIRDALAQFERKAWDVEQYAKAYAQYLANKSEVFVARSQFIKDMLSCTDSCGNSFDWLQVMLDTDFFTRGLPDSVTPWTKGNAPWSDRRMEEMKTIIQEAIDSRGDIVVESYSDWGADSFWSAEAIDMLLTFKSYAHATLTINGSFVRVADIVMSLLFARDGYTDGSERDIPALDNTSSTGNSFSGAQAVLSINESIEAMGVAVSALAGVASLAEDSTPADVAALIGCKVNVITECGKANLNYAVSTLAERSMSLRQRALAYADSISDSTIEAGQAKETDFNPVISTGGYTMRSPSACLATAFEETSVFDRVSGAMSTAADVTKGLFTTVGKWLKSGAEFVVEKYQEHVAPVIENTPLKFSDDGSGCLNEPSAHLTLSLQQLYSLRLPGSEGILDGLIRTNMTPDYWSVFGSPLTPKKEIDAMPARYRSIWHLLYFEEQVLRLTNENAFVCWDNKLFKLYISRKRVGERSEEEMREFKSVLNGANIPSDVWEYHVFLYLCPRKSDVGIECDTNAGFPHNITLDELMSRLDAYADAVAPHRVQHVLAACARDLQFIWAYLFISMCARTQCTLHYDSDTGDVTDDWSLTPGQVINLISNPPYAPGYIGLGAAPEVFHLDNGTDFCVTDIANSSYTDGWGNEDFYNAIQLRPNNYYYVVYDEGSVVSNTPTPVQLPAILCELVADCVYSALTNKVAAMSAFGATGGYSELCNYELMEFISQHPIAIVGNGNPGCEYPYPGTRGSTTSITYEDTAGRSKDIVAIADYRYGYQPSTSEFSYHCGYHTKGIPYGEHAGAIMMFTDTGVDEGGPTDTQGLMSNFLGGKFYAACSYEASFRYDRVFTFGIRTVYTGAIVRSAFNRLPSRGFLVVGRSQWELFDYFEDMRAFLSDPDHLHSVGSDYPEDYRDRSYTTLREVESILDLVSGEISEYSVGNQRFKLVRGAGTGTQCRYSLKDGTFSGSGIAIVPVSAQWVYPYLGAYDSVNRLIPDYAMCTQTTGENGVIVEKLKFWFRTVRMDGTVFKNDSDGIHLREFANAYCDRGDVHDIATDQFPIFRPYSYEVTPPAPSVIIRSDTEMKNRADQLANVITGAIVAAVAVVAVVFVGIKVSKFVKKFVAASKVKTEALNDEALARRKQLVAEGKKRLNAKRKELGVGQDPTGAWVNGSWNRGRFTPSSPATPANKEAIKQLKAIEESFSPAGIAKDPMIMKNAKKRKWEEWKRNLVGSLSGGGVKTMSDSGKPTSDVASDVTMNDTMDAVTREAANMAGIREGFRTLQSKLGGDFGPDLPLDV